MCVVQAGDVRVGREEGMIGSLGAYATAERTQER
jgi:hypothetical protein